VAFLLAAVCAPPAPAQDAGGGLSPEVEMELRYAEALTQMGLPDYAEIVIGRIQDPSAKLRLEVLKLEGLIAQGKFDDVKAVIVKNPNQDSQEAWAMKLALADGYYAWGRYGEAQGIYESFFEKYPNGPPPELNQFFMDSAYKYSQMLLLMNNDKRAVEAYRIALKAQTPQHVRRQVLSEMSDALMKMAEKAPESERAALFGAVETNTTEILWVQDIWFGKAIVLLAHIKMLRGDIEGAQSLIDDYREQLESIDAALQEQEDATGDNLTKMSPMAQCRYLLGVMLQDQAEKLIAAGDKKAALPLLAGGKNRSGEATAGALQHFYNVFVRYPNTMWAPDAGNRAKRVKEMLERDFGARISIQVSEEQWDKVRRLQFQEARSLFNQQQFEPAVEAYLTVLNLFPEGDTSVAAVGELARSYIELQDELMADMTIRYLAECFCEREAYRSRAGDELIRIAEMYGERNLPERRTAVYESFFTLFTKHPRAPSVLFRFGDEQWDKENREGALVYYKRLAETYTNSPLYFDALNKMAFAYHDAGKLAEEVKVLQAYVNGRKKEDRPGPGYINALYRLGEAFRQLGGKHVPSAFNRFAEIEKSLTENPARFQKTAEDEAANAKILPAAIFYKAYCYSLLEQPPEKVQGYKQQAIKSYANLVAKYPQSEFAPVALSQVGTLWTVLENPDEARKALDDLRKQYPDSPEAKIAKFVLGNNLLKLGRRRQAMEVFTEMFADAQVYSAAQLLTVANEMQNAGEFDLALKAYDMVLAKSQERAHREPALMGKGKVLIEKTSYAEGAATLETLLKEFENSGHTIMASFYLSRAYSSLGAKDPDADKRFDLFNNAMLAMKKMRKFAKEKGDQAASDIEVARIFVRKAKAEAEFGAADKAAQNRNDAVAAFQALILLGDAQDPKVRPHIEDAYLDCLPLLMEIERYQDAFEDAGKYLETFPSGKYVTDIRGFRSQARMKMETLGIAPEAGAEPPAEEPAAAPEASSETAPEATPEAAAPETPAPAPEAAPAPIE
jgi:tetratricopeptide (TPR) repeat protein